MLPPDSTLNFPRFPHKHRNQRYKQGVKRKPYANFDFSGECITNKMA